MAFSGQFKAFSISVLFLLPSLLSAQAPSTYTVRKDNFVVPVTLSGIFESSEMEEVSLNPKAWSQLTVVEAVPAGQEVREGEVILVLDTEDIDKTIGELKHSLVLADISFELAKKDFEIAQKTIPMDLKAAQQASKDADEALVRYLKRGKKLREKSEHVALKSISDALAYQMEELKQLEKMYKADDLTEETEEIVLQRQRNVVERMKFSVEMAKEDHRVAFESSIPSRERGLKDSAIRTELEYHKAKLGLPAKLKKQELALSQQKISLQRMKKKLQDLLRDRKSLKVKAPMDGVVYYGQCVNGRWVSQGTISNSLKKGGTILSKQVFMTIVNPKKLRVSSSVTEAQLRYFQGKVAGYSMPLARPGTVIKVSLTHVDSFPASGSSYRARFKMGEGAKGVVPGMTCQLSFIGYQNKEALVVPNDRVFSEPGLPHKKFVWVETDDADSKAPVKIGHQNATHVEIIEGLSEGQKILAKKPE